MTNAISVRNLTKRFSMGKRTAPSRRSTDSVLMFRRDR